MRALALLLLAPLLAPLAGCLSCQPTLDVRHCPEPVGSCAPRDGDRVVVWDDDLGALWPDIPRLFDLANDGGHHHAAWTQEQADAFWRFWQVPLDKPDKQVFLEDESGTYRVRVLDC